MKGDEQPISFSQEASEGLGLLLLRALNKNQLLILNELSKSNGESITQILCRISKSRKLAVSTLRLNARILLGLGLIEFGNNSHFRLAELTEFGKIVFSLLSRHSLTSRAVGCNPTDAGANPVAETRGE